MSPGRATTTVYATPDGVDDLVITIGAGADAGDIHWTFARRLHQLATELTSQYEAGADVGRLVYWARSAAMFHDKESDRF